MNAGPDYDVVIVGAGVAGAIIAKQLIGAGKNVLILEAGDTYQGRGPDGLYPLKRFYLSTAKGAPESPYTPDLFDANGNLADPAYLAAPRPTVLTLAANNWQDTTQSYLIQQGPLPFGSTYERTAGGTTRHWLGSSFRLCPNDFRAQSEYGVQVDWPIGYDDLAVAPSANAQAYYERAELELGVSADVSRQSFLGIEFSPGYAYPMPGIVPSLVDAAVTRAAPSVEVDGIALAVTPTPAARNSVPFGDVYKRPQCQGNTNCIPLCPIQAKYDATATLAALSQSPALTLWWNTVASQVVVGSDGTVSAIEYLQYDPLGQKPTIKGSVSAKRYVVAASAIETARLLLMSTNGGTFPNGVANGSGQVGKNLMDHPCYLAWAQAAEPVYPYRGPLSTSGIENARDGAFRAQRAAFRVEIGNDGWDWPTGDPYTTPVDLILGTNVGQLNPSGDVVFGTELVQRLNAALTRQFRVAMLVEQSPEDRNAVTLAAQTDGLGLPRPQITYDLSDYTKQGYVAAVQAASKLFEAMGATEFTAPPAANDPSAFTVDVGGKPVAVKVWGAGHIAGTYRMGSDPASSVVDRTQRSWDHQNLFLVGSGVFPTIATGNPTLTIAALAFWAADTLIADLA